MGEDRGDRQGSASGRGVSRRRLLAGAAALCAVGAGGAVAWAAYGKGGVLASPEPRWTFRAGAILAPFAVADGVLVLVGENEVVGVDIRTGRRLWTRPADLRMWNAGGEVLAMTYDVQNHTDYSQGTQMERLSARTGELVPVGGDLGRPLRSPLRELHDTGEPGVVHLEHLNSVAVYDLRSGRLLWERSHPQAVPRAVSGDVLLCSSGNLGEVTALDRGDGSVRWRRRAFISAGDLRPFTPASVEDGRFFAGGRDVVALDAATGTQLWRWGADRDVRPGPERHFYVLPRVVDGVVYLVVRDEAPPDRPRKPTTSLLALDAGSGEHLWSYRHSSLMDVVRVPLVHRGVVYVGTEDSRQPLLAVDRRTHSLLWSFRPPEAEDSEWRGGYLLAEGTMYVNSGMAVSALDLGGSA